MTALGYATPSTVGSTASAGTSGLAARQDHVHDGIGGSGGGVPTSRVLTAGAGLTGGGDLTVDRTFTVAAGDTSITINADSIQVALAATSGLAVSSGLLIADSIAGAGLTISSKVLAVGAGTLITVAADTVGITAGANYQFIGTGAGTAAAWQNLSSLAGAGLTHTTGILAVGAGTMITVNADDVQISAGATYQFIGTGSGTAAGWRNVSELAGAGLTAALGVLAVGAGDTSITVNADSIQVALAATSGLQISSGLMIADTVAGAGLTITNKVLAVGAGTLIAVAADSVGITTGANYQFIGTGAGTSASWVNLSTLAGAGLTAATGILAVGAGAGLTVNADDVALTTPGTLSVSSTNAAAGSHTHAITSSTNPGAAASLLASDASGYLQLVRLGLGVAPAYVLHARVGADQNFGVMSTSSETRLAAFNDAADTLVPLRIDASVIRLGCGTTVDGDLTFVGAQSITTTTDNLSLTPAGDLILDPTGNDVLPATGYDLNIGSLQKKYLTLHAAELWVETLVAQNTIATIGGRILVGPTTTLIEDLAAIAVPGTSNVKVKYNNLGANTGTEGSVVYLEANALVEFWQILIHDTPDVGKIYKTVAGGYEYKVTRDYEASGSSHAWCAGDAIFNTGTTGDGFIDLYSVRGVKSATQYGPTIVGNLRNSATYNDWTEHWAIGNLNGIYGYSATTMGFAAGKYSTTTSWLSADATNGIRMMRGSTQLAKWDVDGNILIGQAGTASQSSILISAGKVAIRNGVANDEKIVLNADGTASFTGSITAASGAIGGWAIGATSLTDAAGLVGMSSAVTGGDDIRFWAGHATPASAPFRVTEAGVLVATSGAIGGWTINSQALFYDSGADASSSGMMPGDWSFYAGKMFADRATAPFRVSVAGALVATSATITGAITATSGTIGSFTIGTYLYTGSKTAYNDANAGVHVGSDGIGIGNNVFTVSSAGALVATSATITGAITASSGSFTGVVNIGASGGIFQGTGTFATPTTALKIWNSGGAGVISGFSGGTEFWRINGGFGIQLAQNESVWLGTNPGGFDGGPYDGRLYSNGTNVILTGIPIKIYASANSTTGLQFTKADGTTAVLTVDTSNGQVTIGGPIHPATSDGGALGSTTLMWSDLFLASGSVINFNNGDVTITHAANALTVAGGSVGIGGTPFTPLTVQSADFPALALFWPTLTGDQGPNLEFHTYNGSSARVQLGVISGRLLDGTAGNEDGYMLFATMADGSVAERARIYKGLQVGTPTGGDKGAGTINVAGDIYKNNSAYNNPDYVFDHWLDGWSKADNYGGLKPLADLDQYVREHRHLPGISREAAGIFARADMVLEKLEEAYLHLIAHEKRLLALET